MLSKIYRVLAPDDRVKAAVVLAAILVMAAVEVVGVGSVFSFMKIVAEPSLIEESAVLSDARDVLGARDTASFLTAVGLAVLGVIVFRNAFGAFSAWLQVRFVMMTNHSVASRLLETYLNRPLAFHLATNSARSGKNVLIEATQLVGGSLMSLVRVCADGAVAAAVVGYLLWQDTVTTSLVVAVLGGGYSGVYLLLRRRLGDLGRARMRADEGRFKAVSESLGGVREIKLFAREPYFLDRFSESSLRLARLEVVNDVLKQAPRFAFDALAFGGLIAIALITLARDPDPAETIGVLTLYGVAGYRLVPSLHRVLQGISAIRFNTAVLDRLHDDLVSAPGTEPALGPSAAERLPFARDIRLESLGFRYAGAERAVIDGLDLVIPARGSVAFVGPTGAGKSTLVDLIAGLLEPTSGRVLVDGVALGPETRRRWRPNIGYVPQHIYLSDATLTQNIAFGIPDERIDHDAVVRAARMAHLHEFVTSRLAEGYGTPVGERGVRLSGGQRQRVGIARALYHAPSLLIFDEATSALDGITEEVIGETLRSLEGELAMILIAHRLTTVRSCDIIHLMSEGRIVDSGTYGELMRDNATFRRMAGAAA